MADEAAAALKIQAIMRGRMSRRESDALKDEQAAGTEAVPAEQHGQRQASTTPTLRRGVNDVCTFFIFL